MRFSRSTHLLCLYLVTLTSIIRTGLLILVKLIDLVNYVIFFLSQMTLLWWLTFLLGSQISFCTKKDKSSESKVKFRQASSRCKRFLEAAKLAYVNKTKKSSLPRNVALRTFRELLIVFSTKVNLLYLLYSTVQSCCLLHLIKQNCLLKPFLRILIMMTQVSLFLLAPLELIWNCIIFL